MVTSLPTPVDLLITLAPLAAQGTRITLVFTDPLARCATSAPQRGSLPTELTELPA